MPKKLMYTIYGFILAWFIFIFSITTNAEQNRPLKIWYENSNGNIHTFNLVDDNTKVNYIVVESVEFSNSGVRLVAICPRYNPDGSLYIG